MTPAEKRAQRAQLIAQSRVIFDKSQAEKRAMSSEESAEFDRISAAADALKVDYTRQENLEATEAELRTSQGTQVQRELATKPTDEAVTLELRRTKYEFAPGTDAWKRHQPNFRKAFRNWLATGHEKHAGEMRALQTDSDQAGGYLTVPEEFVAEYIKTVDDLRWIRKLSRTMATNASSIGAPKRAAKMATFGWGAELSTPTADVALKFGKRTMQPHYLTGEILISRDLLRANVLSVEGIVQYEMARDAGELEENAFMTGSGVQQPLGIFTKSTDGISTARDFNAGNTTTAIGPDNLVECKYQLKPQYRQKAVWVFNRQWIKSLRKLKDGEGQYLWQPGITAGDPDRILGLPFYESEFSPYVPTTGQYAGVLGDFSNYWIVDGLQMDMQRLIEKYAEQNQVAIIARAKVDGMPILEEAFSRVTLA